MIRCFVVKNSAKPFNSCDCHNVIPYWLLSLSTFPLTVMSFHIECCKCVKLTWLLLCIECFHCLRLTWLSSHIRCQCLQLTWLSSHIEYCNCRHFVRRTFPFRGGKPGEKRRQEFPSFWPPSASVSPPSALTPPNVWTREWQRMTITPSCICFNELLPSTMSMPNA